MFQRIALALSMLIAFGRGNRNMLAPRSRIPRFQNRRMIPGFQRRGILNRSSQTGAFAVSNIWEVSGPTVGNNGVNIPIGPSPTSYAGSKYVIDASTYNMHYTTNVFLEFIPSQNRFNAKNQICVWLTSDPDAVAPITDEQVRQQCLAAKGFTFHSEFTFRQNLHVPPALYKNFSTGSGDSASGTAFQPQGRIFVIPLDGTDTTDWTYGTLNIRFQTRLSGPGTSLAPASASIPDDPFSFNTIHNISSWTGSSKRAIHEHYYVTSAIRYLLTWEEGPTIAANAVVYEYTENMRTIDPDSITNFPPDIATWNYWRSVDTLPLNAKSYWQYSPLDEDNNTFGWVQYEPTVGEYVKFSPGTRLNVTTESILGHHSQFRVTPVDEINRAMLAQDEEGNTTLSTTDRKLNILAESLRLLVDTIRVNNLTQLGNLTNEVTEFRTQNSEQLTSVVQGEDNIVKQLQQSDYNDGIRTDEIISALGGVVKKGDFIEVTGEITVAGVPPVEGAAELLGVIT